MIPGRGHFWTQWHDLNKFGRGLLSGDTYQISRLCLAIVASDKRIFILCQKCAPGGGVNFGTRGILS